MNLVGVYDLQNQNVAVEWLGFSQLNEFFVVNSYIDHQEALVTEKYCTGYVLYERENPLPPSNRGNDVKSWIGKHDKQYNVCNSLLWEVKARWTACTILRASLPTQSSKPSNSMDRFSYRGNGWTLDGLRDQLGTEYSG